MTARRRSTAPRAGVAWLRTLLGVATALTFTLGASAVRAGSERPAGIIVFPRIEVNSANGVDTLIEIANTNGTSPVSLLCVYVDATPRCSASHLPCSSANDCLVSETCGPDWSTIDFLIQLSQDQALGWRAGQGLPQLPCDPALPNPCPGFNAGTIPPTTTDPFFGELRCVEVSDVLSATPVAGNDMIGNATVLDSTRPDAASYTAIGIESTGTNDGNGVLCLGADVSGECTVGEYAFCPDVLIYNHFFEGAAVAGATIENDLTLAPCSEDYTTKDMTTTQVQVIVFNEFEERRCSQFPVQCLTNLRLADNPLWSVGVEGSLAGQTRMRSVPTSETDVGHKVVGIALERRVNDGTVRSSAHALQYQGIPLQADVIRIPSFP